MKTTKDRILIFLEYLGMGQNAFEKKCGISNGYISNSRGSFGSRIISKISTAYPDLNDELLMTGEVTMLKSESISEKDADFRLVPMYNLDARGGFGGNEEGDVAE